MSRMRPLLLAIAAALLSTAVTFAQTGGSLTARPDRGASIGGAYSSSGLDNVSLTGGGLNVSIPLVSLPPPIAGGKLSLTITANYNSKLWDVVRKEERVIGTIGRRIYVVDAPQLSPRGGWRIGGPGYEIVRRDAHEDYDYDQPQQFETTPTDWLWVQNNREWHRLYLVTPDGAEHELIPSEGGVFYSGFERSYLKGSFSDTPNGAPTRYHTVDGTYVSVVYNSPGDWCVTLPDGTQATLSAEGQRIKDTNGNSILIYPGTDGATHYKDVQSGREIRVTGDVVEGYQVWYRTVGEGTPEQHVDVNVEPTVVRGKLYRVNAWNASGQTEEGNQGTPCVHNAILDTAANNQLTLSVVKEIVFPATEPGQLGRKFTFTYNSDTTEPFTANYSGECGQAPAPLTTTASKGLGELSGMKTPTGAVYEYEYSLDHTHNFQINLDEITRDMVTIKKLAPEGAAENEKNKWTYNINVLGGGGAVTNPDGTSATEAAYIQDPGYSTKSGGPNGLGGKVFSSRTGNILVQRRWRANPNGLILSAPSGVVAVNPLVEAEFTSLIENNVAVRMSATTYQYDLNGNLLQTKAYDWFDPATMTRDEAGIPEGEPPSSALLRQTNISYYNTAASLSADTLYINRATSGATLVINAPRESVTGANITRFRYDGQEFEQPPLKGNVTQVESFDDQGDADAWNDRWVTAKMTYDPTYGNVSTTTDANGNVTHFYYEDDTHALPTKVEVDPSNGTSVQTTLTTYDFRTGLVTSMTDVNGQTTTIDYTNHLLQSPDPFGRPGTVTGPAVLVDGVSQRRKALTTYEDSLRRVTVESDLKAEGDRLLKSRVTSDALGRPVLTEQSEDGASYTVFTRAAYEQGGRVTYASNPMRTSAAATDSWTRTTKDTNGRVIEVATFAGATKPAATDGCTQATGCTGKVVTDYYAEFVTVVDQVGKVRRSKTDALGQLVRVDEPSDSNNTLGDYQSPTQPSVYIYDTLGNLVTVRQGGQLQSEGYVGGQTRSFSYSSLSRLSSATSPEMCQQGASQCVPVPVTYKYDPNGNLTKKTDARGTDTIYTYDALNRVTSRSYAGGTAEATPSVAYFYDSQSPAGAAPFDHGLSTGRLVAVTYGGGTLGNYIGGFDAAGRVTFSRQVTETGTTEAVKTYEMSYTYDLAGNLKSEKYPSGRVVASEYDSAGRIAGVKNQDSGLYYAGAAATDAANRIGYLAPGAVSTVRLGNGLWEHTNFDSRLRPVQIGLGTSGTDSSTLQLDYTYGTDNSHNNGNISSQTIKVPGMTQPYVQTYGYDELNRLKTAEEVNTQVSAASPTWKQVYAYDRYGNRNLAAGTTLPNYSLPDPVGNPVIDPANNRISTSTAGQNNYIYDAAGNLTRTPAESRPYHDLAYDAENRQVKVDGGASAGGADYSYDGVGRRVKKVVGTVMTVFVYDVAGRIVAEYGGEQSQTTGTSYITQDTLGSTRVVTGQNPSEVRGRYDYLPFGEELYVGRSNYGGVNEIRQKFTGYERDSEADSDFAKARNYKYTQGRFTSPDPLMASMELTNPQTFNRYGYVTNNPVRFTDPTGMSRLLDERCKNQMGSPSCYPNGARPGSLAPTRGKRKSGSSPLPDEVKETALAPTESSDNYRLNGEQGRATLTLFLSPAMLKDLTGYVTEAYNRGVKERLLFKEAMRELITWAHYANELPDTPALASAIVNESLGLGPGEILPIPEPSSGGFRFSFAKVEEYNAYVEETNRMIDRNAEQFGVKYAGKATFAKEIFQGEGTGYLTLRSGPTQFDKGTYRGIAYRRMQMARRAGQSGL